MEPFAGTVWSRRPSDDLLAVQWAQPGSCRKSANGVGRAALAARDADLHRIVAREPPIGSPLFVVGGFFLKHQRELMAMKQSVEIHETELLLP
jgi:hypothetical protein